MSESQTLLLCAIAGATIFIGLSVGLLLRPRRGARAGATIFIGLPLARVRSTLAGARAGLTALATGILIFLLWDVLAHGVEPVESALDESDWTTFAEYVALLAGGFAVGLMGLV